MKVWLLVMASAVFLLCVSQRAFAGCTDEDDLNGTACRASSNCGTPCSLSFGGIQSRQASPILNTKPLQASSVPVERAFPVRSFSISFSGLSLLALVFSSVILYRGEPEQWRGLIAEKRGRV
jgi:hypothetical protein